METITANTPPRRRRVNFASPPTSQIHIIPRPQLEDYPALYYSAREIAMEAHGVGYEGFTQYYRHMQREYKSNPLKRKISPAPQKSRRVTFASPPVSEIHTIPRPRAEDLPNIYWSTFDIATAEYRCCNCKRDEALATAAAEKGEIRTDEDAADTGGTLICPSGLQVTFAEPLVTDVWIVPKVQDKDSAKLYYTRYEIASFFLSELQAGRKLWGGGAFSDAENRLVRKPCASDKLSAEIESIGKMRRDLLAARKSMGIKYRQPLVAINAYSV